MKMGQLELPGMPSEYEESYLRRTERAQRWYFVTDARKERQIGAEGENGDIGWIDRDLRNPAIMLFNVRRTACRYAVLYGGVVEIYPYDPATLRSRR